MLAINPRAAVAANNLAWMQLVNGKNLDEAAALARTAQQVLPDDPNVNDTLGWILFKKGDASGAVTYLEKSLAANPEDPGYQYHLGLAYAQLGLWDKAKPALTRALGAQPGHPEAAAARKALSMIGG